MLLRELYEQDGKTAVIAFGRLNPPTVGHAKLVDKIKSIPGDHFLFLSHTQKPKTDPLDFATKKKFAQQFFPDITIGHEAVKTPVLALEYLQGQGYTDVIFVAGSDRVEGFQKLFDTYNGQPDKTGKIPFKFNSIRVVSAGERDPDADDVSGMSASKMRAAAASDDLQSFAQGVPDKRLAQTMYDAVRAGMGVIEEASKKWDDNRRLNMYNPDSDMYMGKSMPGRGKRLPDPVDKAQGLDAVPDGSYEIDFDNLDKEKLKKVVAKLIPTLGHKKNEMVLKARFGLAPFEKEYTFRQIANAMGVTPEVIRQREAKALRQLKHISRSRELRPFLDGLDEDTSLTEFDVRTSKKYQKADTYKGYEIYTSVDPVLQGQYMSVAYDRNGKEAFRGKGRVPEQAANMIKDTIDGRQQSASKVQGNATIDFNAQFSRELIEPGMDKIYAKIIAGPKLVVANSEYYDDAEALAEMGFKPTAFRTKNGLLAMGMTAKQTQGAELIANGRYYVGDKSYDEYENSVYNLDFHSVVNDKNEKYSLGKPGLTVGTRRQSTVDENFADGKKPGRKGLAKRSGVNTKASVSSLRKTAKNSSGEKQRMAHWLANMKAGRAKKK
jgi:hypothetical protein